MAKQIITWTTLPGGVSADNGLRFAVHVAPRLQTTGAADASLGEQFPDFVDWPATLQGRTAELVFPDLGVSFPAEPVTGADPDGAKWRALFPENTLVRDHAVPVLTGIKMPSYPVAHVVGFLAEQWGKVGATKPEDHPAFDDLIGSFRDIGFLDLDEREGPSGWDRLEDLRGVLEERYTKHGGAIPYVAGDANTATGRGLSFLQLLDFHQRGLTPSAGPPPIRVRQRLDFHQAVALTANHRLLQRLLGLVLEFRVPPNRLLTGLLAGPVQTGWCTVRLTVPNLDAAMTTPVLPLVRSDLGDSRFEAAPRTGDDLSRGLLRVGVGSRFGVVTVDPDGGALKAMQFAATLTRSHIFNGTDWRPRSLGTTENYPLPTLRTGGISVARLGMAFTMLTGLKDKLAVNEDVYDPPGGTPADLELYAEDLVRGYRWDVRDTADTRWRTLMERDGKYKLLRLPADQREVPVREEAAVVTAVTTATADTDSKDLYLQESIVSWGGWSLAVSRPGNAVGLEGQVGPAEQEVDDAYQFDTEFAVVPATLPRLRFGHEYRFRARAVDIGNGGLPYTEGDLPLGGPDTVTATQRFLRFEPVEAPTVALRRPRWPGESPAHLAVREGHGSSERHVVPPRTAQLMAEWHGALDLDTAGHPIDPAFWAQLDARDSARLEDLLDPNQTWDPHDNPAYFDTDALDVPYLPDVLARSAVIRGLPPAPLDSEVVPFADGAWPSTRSFRLVLGRAPAGGATWSRSGQLLNVRLEPGDVYQLKISCRFGVEDLELMGVWDWIKTWVAKWNASHPPAEQINLDTIRGLALRGRHWMLTPWRPTTLVHAVRTPLVQPTWVDLSVNRVVGSTSAHVGDRRFTLGQKTTGTVDVVGSWQMPIDNGPGTQPDPSVKQPFGSTAYSVAIKHPIGPAPDQVEMHLQGDHEFGDHKYRRVAYQAVGTTPFVEYFREEVEPTLSGPAQPLPPDTALSTVKVRAKADGKVYQPAPRGQHDPATAAGDYIVDPAGKTIQRTAGGTIPPGATVVVSFAREPITRAGNIVERDVRNSVRPAAPKVRYVVPTFKWEPIRGGSRRLGGGLRVYLERPWWSSGDGERLGVVLWPSTAVPPEPMRPYVTGWAPDPVTVSAQIPKDGPDLTSFPLSDANPGDHGVTIAEVPDTLVDVAGHSVAFDSERDLWYCDLRVTLADETELPAYFPHIRLALARYQPNSLPDCHLSKIVLAEYIQLANNRAATIVAAGTGRTVTVTGRAFTANSMGAQSRVQAVVERRNNIADPDLGWEQVGPAYSFSAGISDGNDFTWSATIPAPTVRGTYRLVVQEFERMLTGDLVDGGPGPAQHIGSRAVYTEILPFS